MVLEGIILVIPNKLLLQYYSDTQESNSLQQQMLHLMCKPNVIDRLTKASTGATCK